MGSGRVRVCEPWLLTYIMYNVESRAGRGTSADHTLGLALVGISRCFVSIDRCSRIARV
jgi:hypothetical protein